MIHSNRRLIINGLTRYLTNSHWYSEALVRFILPCRIYTVGMALTCAQGEVFIFARTVHISSQRCYHMKHQMSPILQIEEKQNVSSMLIMQTQCSETVVLEGCGNFMQLIINQPNSHCKHFSSILTLLYSAVWAAWSQSSTACLGTRHKNNASLFKSTGLDARLNRVAVIMIYDRLTLYIFTLTQYCDSRAPILAERKEQAEMWCLPSGLTNHSCCGRCCCDMQLDFWSSAHQATM